jgi:mono/diheme cytochrome c family protein
MRSNSKTPRPRRVPRALHDGTARRAAGFRLAAAFGLLAVASAPPALAAQDPAPPPFTEDQVKAGAEVYAQQCAACHGTALEGTIAPPLLGKVFRANWYLGDRTAGDLFSQIAENMPMTAPASLTPGQYAALTAFVLARNGHGATGEPLAPDAEALDAYPLVAPDSASGTAPDEENGR